MWRLILLAGRLSVRWVDDIPKNSKIVSIHGSKKEARSALTSARKQEAKGKPVEGKLESKIAKEARLNYAKKSKEMGEENLQKYLKQEQKRRGWLPKKPIKEEIPEEIPMSPDKYKKLIKSDVPEQVLKKKHGAEVRKKLTDLGYKSKGGSVKKYAHGGGVRAARF
jgi:hypothetical protein